MKCPRCDFQAFNDTGLSVHLTKKHKASPHGATRYGRGCRCKVCKTANSDRLKAYRRARKELAA